MSIFDTLAESGVTQEDLEKAASARLFAEAAAAEGIDLSELTEDQAEELYEFWANGGEEVEKSASAEGLLAEAAVKEASAKLAEAEYIGRYMARVYADELDKIAAGEQVLHPHMSVGPARSAADSAAAFEEAFAAADKTKKPPKVEKRSKVIREAKAKATEAAPRGADPGQFSEMAGGRLVGAGSESANAQTAAERAIGRKRQSLYAGRKATLGERGRVLTGRISRHIRANPKAYGAAGLATLAGGGYAAHRAMGGGKEARASAAIEEMAYLRAEELAATLSAFGELPERTYMNDVDAAVDSLAVEMLIDNGWL